MYWKTQIFPIGLLHWICYDCNICTVMHYVFYSLYYMFSLLCVLECNKESWSNKGWLIIILQRYSFLSKAVPESEEPTASDHLFFCLDIILLPGKGMVIALESAFSDSWHCMVKEEESKEERFPLRMENPPCAPVFCFSPSFHILQFKYQMLSFKRKINHCSGLISFVISLWQPVLPYKSYLKFPTGS